MAPKAYLCDVATGSYCDSTDLKCTAIGNVGDTCNTSGGSYACVKTAYCDFATKTCAAKKAVGETCSGSFPDPCSAGNFCDATRKCAMLLVEGAACTSSQMCASSSCVNGKCSKSGTTDLGLAFICGGG